MAENNIDFSKLLKLYDFYVGCEKCCQKDSWTTCSFFSFQHSCSKSILAARQKIKKSRWSLISSPPVFCKPKRYVVCKYFDNSKGCEAHGNKCTFARCQVEASVWNFLKERDFCYATLLKLSEGRALFSQPVVEVNHQSIKERILHNVPGSFVQLCEMCFHSKTQKISRKGNASSCSARQHPWKPILVQQYCGQYKKVRPRPQSNGTLSCVYRLCEYVIRKELCRHGDDRCRFAHNEVELEVWTAECNEGLDRSVLPSVHKPQLKAAASSSQRYDCQACDQQFGSKGCLMNHCNTLQHSLRLMTYNSTTRIWKYRDPPPKRQSYKLCERPSTCVLGNRCVDAHSEDELQEWHKRDKQSRKELATAGEQGLISYQDNLLQEYRDNINKALIMSDAVPGVTVTCNQELMVSNQKGNEPIAWLFHIQSDRPLAEVALLKQEQGAFFTLGQIGSEVLTYCSGEMFHQKDFNYLIPVSFKPNNLGIYEEWLVLDFDTRPVLLQKLKVKVGGPQNEKVVELPGTLYRHPSESMTRWHPENMVIVSYLDRADEHKELLNEYKPPLKILDVSDTHLSHENYKDQMHNFLYKEELAEHEILSRLNFCGAVTLSDTLNNTQFGMKIAPEGELFCAISVPYTLTPDTSQGCLLKQSVLSALIAPVSLVYLSSKAYEAVLLHDAISQTADMTDSSGTPSDIAMVPHLNYTMHLQISKRCCSDLKLQRNGKCEMEIQFQLNRLPFCEMHKALDQLPDTKSVLPDFSNCAVPVYQSKLPEHFNAKQSEAVRYIKGNLDLRKDVAPLLIYGPFGTGKTFTLAAASRELVCEPRNKVLICTHTNSSADLYVRDHFHPFCSVHNKIKAVRVKENKPNAVSATDAITLKYCLSSQDGTKFLPPTKSDLDCHRIVIATTTMARQFHDLKLPAGYFTHILIDEASQMLESEALMPLGLAGPNTRVVLAGDHMQMGPKLFSVDDHQRSKYTLLNRLFHFYQQQKGDAALKSKIIFSENYRCTKEIVDFVSTQFYVGKTDVIKAVGNVPSHPTGQALKFHHVRGECIFDSRTMSWFNFGEVVTVVDIVMNLIKDWPSIWGQCDPRSICVLSEGCQVYLIRTELRKISMGQVNVENIANVQGKQFRVIVMTTVHTRDSLLASDTSCLEMFNDPCVLNTALTRAQSQVIVVGDAATLCFFGKCSKVWKSYIYYCSNKNCIEPTHVTKEFIDSDVKQISRLFIPQSLESNHSQSPLFDLGVNPEENTDTVLQQMMEEYDMSDEDDSDGSKFEAKLEEKTHWSTNKGNEYRSELPNSQSTECKQAELVSHNSKRQMYSQTRQNHNGPTCKVSDSSSVFVCTFEVEDHNRQKIKSDTPLTIKLLIPISKKISKICIQVHKKDNSVPIWRFTDGQWECFKYEMVDEKLKRNHVFLVKVLCWKDYCTFPLGRVIGLLPIGTSLDEGLRILDEEYNVTNPRGASEELSWEDNDSIPREDLLHITTFTVDKDTSMILDDAISVRDISKHLYEVGVHITDVARVVRPNDMLDENAKQWGASFNLGKLRMLPESLCKQLSLLPGCECKVISLMMEVEKEKEEIINHSFQFSLIKSDKKLSYDDAENIIVKRYGKERTFLALDDCVAVAYRFSTAQRKARLEKDCNYSQSNRDQKPGKRRSHQMIEELMVLFNKYVAEFLIAKDVTFDCTPLRCQANPDPLKERDFQEKYDNLIPLSHIRHAKTNNVKYQTSLIQETETSSFYVLTSVWNDIKLAATGKEVDMDKIVDLVSADDIYPQLLPVIMEFSKCEGKAYVIRSNSCVKAQAGHYSLRLSSYTQATAPIRRYIDIILQRLLHSVLRDTSLPYSQREIDILCERNEAKVKLVEEYEQRAEMISFAVNLKKQNTAKFAFVVDVVPDGNNFKLSFPFDKHIFPNSLPVNYRDLQLDEQPQYNFEEKCIILKWKRRLYSVVNAEIHPEVESLQNLSPCTELSQRTWKDIIGAIDKEDWDMVKEYISSAKTKQVRGVNGISEKESGCAAEEKHYVDLNVQFTTGDTVQVQMTSEIRHCYQTPTVQLICIKPKFEICVNHGQYPINCFSKHAVYPAKCHYSDTNDYVKVWRPICEMESAACAVGESDSIIIEDLGLNLNYNSKSKLLGSFDLPLQCIKKWAIECNLAKCYLCIRKRGIELTPTIDQSKELDPRTFTWVAHGVTCKVEDLYKNSPMQAKKVSFYINHLPMKTIPECVLGDHTTFTVELIPKLLPDVRKENAVNNIVSANWLVQNIAFGIPIPKEVAKSVVPRWHIMQKAPQGLPTLNETQSVAVEKALNSKFTLIQGPPGTGKTVVGVYIVYWFLQLNTEEPRKCEDSKRGEKKEVILYCGPSNKSVDVVAEYLLKLGDSVKPLRVYSNQVEMLEYPYPGSVLQLSVKSLRQAQSKPELRKITLHHCMRQEPNPHSSKIRDFDKRIRLAEQSKGTFTDQEVEDYKKLLYKAREYELRRHDVILCTCTAASTPILTNTVSARQIIIDECAMATEPQTLIPLVCNNPEKIVLLGDHKQLRPIVKDGHARKLGLAKSLFERYINVLRDRSVMLDIQYRMHEDICRFPSETYYQNKLKTCVSCPNSVLQVDGQPKQVVFGNIQGQEISLVVNTAKGNENSKANREEEDQVVRIAKLLVERSQVEQQSIVILSPYNSQVAEIKEKLRKIKMSEVVVTTVTKSQGSEWRYVLLSTVRSLPSEEIEENPDRDWLSKHVGFVGDANQINVGITRAKEGLCIIGNQRLLTCSKAWKQLFGHYNFHKAVTEAERISVRNVVKKP